MVTTILDLLGSLLLILALAWLVFQWIGIVPALATAGVLVLVFSWSVDARKVDK